jgi:hypothetical protein
LVRKSEGFINDKDYSDINKVEDKDYSDINKIEPASQPFLFIAA